MIFLRDDGHHEPDETPNFVPPPALNTKFLFDTNELLKKSDIAVTHSKQTSEFLFDTNEAHKILDIAVTHLKPTTAPSAIRYKWKLHDTLPLCKKIAISLNSAARIPRA
jgi:hypothetical protein